MTFHRRQPAGVPVGGQFATTARGESGVSLSPTEPPVLAAARKQAVAAHAELGAAQGREALEAERTGLMARLRPGRFGDAHEDVIRAQDRASTSLAMLGFELGSKTPAAPGGFERVRHVALLAALGGRVPTLPYAETALTLRRIEANAAQLDAASAGYSYNTVHGASRRATAARARALAAKNVRDALLGVRR